MKYKIKKDLQNLKEISDLINSAYRGSEGNGRWTTEGHLVKGDRIHLNDLEQMILDENIDFVVGYTNNKPIACIAIKCHEYIIELGTFAIDPYLHGKGYGKELLAFAEKYASKYGNLFQVVVVNQNLDLINFYKRRGYLETGQLLPYPVHLNIGEPIIDDINLTVLQKTDN